MTACSLLKRIKLPLLFAACLAALAARAQADTTYYDGGEVKTVGTLLPDSVKTGLWRSWYPSGQLEQAGEYVPFVDSLCRIIILDTINGQGVDTAAIKASYRAQRASLEKGLWVYYYPSGVLSDSGRYAPFTTIEIDFILAGEDMTELVYTLPLAPRSDPIGSWMHYNEDGLPETEIIYGAGGREKMEVDWFYDEDGMLERQYIDNYEERTRTTLHYEMGKKVKQETETY